MHHWYEILIVDWIWWTFLNGFCVSVVLPGVFVFLVLVLSNRLGRGLGMPLLFWVPSNRGRFLIGVGVGCLIWQVFLAGFLSEEFVSNYTWDRPPFCEVRTPLQGGVDHVDFPGRFRYLPTDLRGIWAYIGTVLGAAAAFTVAIGIVAFVLAKLFGDPFAHAWVPYSRKHSIPKPRFGLYLPLGAVVGLALMTGTAWVLFSGVGQVISRPVGNVLVWAGGWGRQAGRQERLAVVINSRRAQKNTQRDSSPDQLVRIVASSARPGNRVKFKDLQQAKEELRLIESTSLAEPTSEDLTDSYAAGLLRTRAFLAPYAPVFGLFTLTFLGMVAVTLLLAHIHPETHLLSPVGWVLFLLNLAVFVSVVLSFFVPLNSQTAICLLVGLVILAGRSYKLQFPLKATGVPTGRVPLNSQMQEPVDLDRAFQRMAQEEARPSAAGSSSYPTFASRNILPFVHLDERGKKIKPPIALVCLSGGGSRAALWTLSVLGRLEREFLACHRLDAQGRKLSTPIAFPYHIRLMTGASGGMLAGAAYVANLKEPLRSGGDGSVSVNRAMPLEGLIAAIGKDFLGRTASQLCMRDLWSMFLPFRLSIDRGWAIEEAWLEAFPGILDKTFADLIEGERAGWRPSLIFSPMLVEDGRELFISNLDLQSVTRNLARVLGSGQASLPGDDRQLISREGVELFRLFPDLHNRLQLVTAARMNASFPYILPAAILPTNPPRRVVDSGYYDNYGVGIAASWLVEHLEWVRENTSGVVLIQIRDGASEKDRLREEVDDSYPSLIARGLQWLTSPPEALWQSRIASNLYRNDNLIHLLTNLLRARGFDEGFLTTAIFEFLRGEDVSLSWTLTNEERQWVAADTADSEIGTRVQAVVNWWQGRLNSA